MQAWSTFALGILLVASGFIRGTAQNAQPPLERKSTPGLIAHVEHDGLSFSVSVDDFRNGMLRIVVPVRFSAPRPTVGIAVHMRDERILGPAVEPLGSVGNGGSVDWA